MIRIIVTETVTLILIFIFRGTKKNQKEDITVLSQFSSLYYGRTDADRWAGTGADTRTRTDTDIRKRTDTDMGGHERTDGQERG